jgi:hypothetical protein
VFVEVVDQPIRVLWLQRSPDWDSRFAALAMRERRDIELHRLTLAGDGADAIMGEALTRDDVDVLVLGRGAASLLDAAAVQLVQSRIEAGTLSLLWFDGDSEVSAPAYAALHPATSIRFADARISAAPPQPTMAGYHHPWLSDLWPRFDQAGSRAHVRPTRLAAAPQPTALVLAQVHGRPAVMEMPLGRGRVMALEAFDLWRWRLRPANDDQPLPALFDAFWTGLLRYLAHGQAFSGDRSVHIELDPMIAQVGERVRIEVTTRDATPADAPLHLQAPDGSMRTLPLTPSPPTDRSPLVQRSAAAFIPEQQGVYHLSVVDASRRIAVRRDDIERFDVAARPAVLATLARATGGAVLSADDDPWTSVARSLDHLAVQTGQRVAQPLLLRAWVMAAIVVLVCIGWMIHARERQA